MFYTRSTFHGWENILKIHLSKWDFDYMIPKGISQTSIPNPKYTL